METITKTVSLKPETTDQIQKIDSSIMYWSLQLGQAMMRLREVESQVASLYEFKKKIVIEDVKSQDVGMESYEISTVDDKTAVVKSIDPGADRNPGG